MGPWQHNNAPSWQPSRSLPAVMSSASLHSVKKQPVVFQAGGRRMYGGAEASVCSGYSQVNTFALLLKVRHKQMEACTPRGFKMTIWPSLSHLFTHCVKPNPVYSSLLLSGLTIELKLRETLLCMWDVCFDLQYQHCFTHYIIKYILLYFGLFLWRWSLCSYRAEWSMSCPTFKMALYQIPSNIMQHSDMTVTICSLIFLLYTQWDVAVFVYPWIGRHSTAGHTYHSCSHI